MGGSGLVGLVGRSVIRWAGLGRWAGGGRQKGRLRNSLDMLESVFRASRILVM